MSQGLQSQDWDRTALGTVANWPLSLQTSLSILLNTACPMVLVWGGDRYLFFNDGYANLGLNSGPTLIPGQPLHDCSQPNGGELLTAIE